MNRRGFLLGASAIAVAGGSSAPANANPWVARFLFRLLVGSSRTRVAGAAARSAGARTVGRAASRSHVYRESTRRAAPQLSYRQIRQRAAESKGMTLLDGAMLASDAAFLYDIMTPDLAAALEHHHRVVDDPTVPKPKLWMTDGINPYWLTGKNLADETLVDQCDLECLDFYTEETLCEFAPLESLKVNPSAEFRLPLEETGLPESVPHGKMVKVVGTLRHNNDVVAIDESGPILIANHNAVGKL